MIFEKIERSGFANANAIIPTHNCDATTVNMDIQMAFLTLLISFAPTF